jgi:hypothetical protein
MQWERLVPGSKARQISAILAVCRLAVRLSWRLDGYFVLTF